MTTQSLLTDEGKTLPPLPWNVYPRPQLVREDWLCLNGKWGLSFNGKQREITVPFCPESLLSGLEEAPAPAEELSYSKSFELPISWRGRKIILHFGAVGRDTRVFLNGEEVCRNDNGFLPFEADITPFTLEGENTLLIKTVNDLNPVYPLGKQSEKRGGMWYTPCSGIWQSVWLEPVPEEYIRSLKITGNEKKAEIEISGVNEGFAEFEGRLIPFENGHVELQPEQPELWSPENPRLYSFSIVSGEDRISSYFALRTLSVEEIEGFERLCLNGKPFFFNGVLDQVYWCDGLYTPAEPSLFEKDILAMKSLGFNTLRKHIKIEPEQFYYLCDKLGMIVFQDMVNNGKYRFFRDTALPTIGLKHFDDRLINRDCKTHEVFMDCLEKTVSLLSNHPSICLWTIFNEGWGQHRSDEAYRFLKELDPSRFIDSTSGWFAGKESDVASHHIYFGKIRLSKSSRPHILSECGGYVFKLPEHSFNLSKTYGYRIYKSREELLKNLRILYESSLLPLVPKGLCGIVYTQLSDVEDETNGLFTFDRKILKIKPEDIKPVMDKFSLAIGAGK